MRDPELLSIVDEILNRQSNSFLRYCVESGGSEIKDDFDRRIWALLDDWYRGTEHNRRALANLLSEEDYFPRDGRPSLHFAQFNFLTPTNLLRHIVRLMEPHFQMLEAKTTALAAWPQARDLVVAILEREQPYLNRVKELQAEQPAVEPKPARIKGTSASRW